MNMAETRGTKVVEQGETKIRNVVPIAVTPEGFWCCPSPVGFQKSQKLKNPVNKPKSPPPPPPPKPRKQTSPPEKKPVGMGSMPVLVPDEKKVIAFDAASLVANERPPRQKKAENAPRKVAIEFGEPGTSDLRVILLGKQGFAVKLSVHKRVLVDNSNYFASKITDSQPVFPCIEVDEFEDVEVCVETVGLMYCRELKQRLMKLSVPRVLRILKVAEQLGFTSCIQLCLEYLEAVPWVGEEEEKVVASVLRLQCEGIGVSPVLKRVSSDVAKPPEDTLSHILDLVLKSNEERGRREMKSVVLKLLKENSSLPGHSDAVDICYDNIYGSCRSCLDKLLSTFRQATDPEFNNDKTTECREPLMKHIALQADNLSWLLEILAERQAADEFASLWAREQELASLHSKLPMVNRYHVSCITARLFVKIGRGELLPSKDTRHLLIQTWLQPLISDYSWLQHGCRSFDSKVVEEGIGRTILTLPLEDQQSILLAWLSSFLKAGDNCPNLAKAFEVWWRRTFIRPYIDSSNLQESDSLVATKDHGVDKVQMSSSNFQDKFDSPR